MKISGPRKEAKTLVDRKVYIKVLCKPYTVCSIKVKRKVHPRTGHEGPNGEERYGSTLSTTLVLDGVPVQRHALGALTPRKKVSTHHTGG